MDIAGIIKAVGKDPKKMWTLVVILFFLCGASVLKQYFTESDCTPLVKQNEELVNSQRQLVDQNQDVLKKNSELIGDYLKLQKLLSGLKPDTVFIVKTTTGFSKEDVQILTRVTHMYSDTSVNDSTAGETVQSSMMQEIKPFLKTKTTMKYKAVNDSVLQEMNSIINKHSK